MPEFQFVDLTQPDGLVSALQSVTRIGIDTEFMREKTYFAQLCLVQVAAGEGIWCADPLPADDLAEFWDALLAPAWVLHSGRQDLEVVQQAAGRLPAEVFDTQVAAALLGHAPQTGYASLVAELFGIELAKSHTRADWSRRPLSQAVLDYAAEDVAWLLPAHDKLCEALEARGRLEWAREDSAELLDPTLYAADAGSAVDRVKAARNLRGRPRRAVVQLAEWRERRAIHSNKPRQWVLRDAVLLDIAMKNPRSTAELGAIDDLPAGTVRRSGDELLELLAAAERGDDDYVPPERPDAEHKARMKALQKRVATRAAELGIAAEVLAPRRELDAALNGDRNLRLFRGWRRSQFGDELLAAL